MDFAEGIWREVCTGLAQTPWVQKPEGHASYLCL